MDIKHPTLLADIEAFLSRHKMGESYFGKAAAGNSELIARLREGGRIWPETEAKVRLFIAERTVVPPQATVRARRSAQADVAKRPNEKVRAAS